MYGRFVGLDIGKYDVRVSLVKRGLRDVQLLQTVSTAVPEGQDGAPEYLGDVFKDNTLPRGDAAASLKDNPTSIRIIKFPFSDPKKIDQVYEYELESISTFDPSEKIYSYHMVKDENGSEALVCVFEKDQVGGLLDSLNSVGIDPKVITYSPLAFGALDDMLEGKRPVLLIDIGDSEMGFSLFDDNGLVRVRSSAKPIEEFFTKLSAETGVPDSELNYSALDYSGDLFANGKEERRKECMAPLLNEIKKTIQFFEIELKEKINTILVSGSLSLIPGTMEHISSELNRDVKKLYIPELGVDKTPLFAKSYALALYGSALKNGYMNLRKDEFKYEGRDSELRKVFTAPVALAAILILVLIYNATSRYFDLKSEVGAQEDRIAEVVKATFPNVKSIPRPVQFMESEVQKVREKLNLIQGVEGGPTALDVLRDISANLPSSMMLTVKEIKFEGVNKVKIQGVCDSYQEVTKIEEALSKSAMFESVVRNQTGNAVDGKTKFEISIQLKSKV